MRDYLYRELVKKHIGCFDLRENSPGVLTSALASEAQQLNGASTEGLALILESLFSVCCGIVLGFIFNWRLSLVALALVPFMMSGGYISAKIQLGLVKGQDEGYKEANLLASDAILNYKTVASLSADQ